MKVRKTTVSLTEKQLEDIIGCVGYGIDHAIAYGMVTLQEQALLEANRIRLEEKLKKALANFPSVHTRP